ncbi:hypothetical protein [Chitinophaga rhizophila]|uniref:YD repeat-containing protein n=1 Tax=Chitinophaga rhizophila TaxID=2866212 RepID=A0ABS7GD41_9BACT|nr:hypothetical protein [Chitinophaga rhizophila]MBW8685587.1 hypothetical protein [Chitinophaga rhizophila]
MPNLNTPLRMLYVCLVLCLTITACKKGDHPWPGPGQPPCKCDAQSFEAWYQDDDHTFPSPFIRPYKFTKTYDANGWLNTLYENTDSPNPVFQSVTIFSKQGNKAFLRDSASLDTVLIVELNQKGLPVKTDLRYLVGGPISSLVKYYHYNHKNQLVAYEDSTNKQYYRLTYDQQGNVRQYIYKNTGAVMVDLTYDYSTPIKGAAYFLNGWIGIFTELEYLYYMGYLDLTPHHKLVRAVNNFRYPFYDRYYTDQVINAAGYVTNYVFTLHNSESLVNSRTVWHCPGDNQHITQYLH